MPVLDENPACPREERYKALAGLKEEGGLFAYQSPDGIHWTLLQEKPVITNGAFDSANLAFWDPSLGKYRAYWRIFTAAVTEKDNWKPAGYRAIRTATSADFLHWDKEADLSYVDSPDEHLYINNVAPYYRAPHILVGTPERYIDRGWSPLVNHELCAQALAAPASHPEIAGATPHPNSVWVQQIGRNLALWFTFFPSMPPG